MSPSRMTEQVGRVLGGRYRLRAPVGRGASAQVFVADDVRLQRRVAVKVLHDALSDDVEFLRRFRAEARAVGALNHPNVMAVYDSGQDDEAAYLVTEYLGGGSLRSLLDRGHRLSLSQALLVGVQAARGLDYAHRRGFVHRDVKPANLLFDEDARLRIADFGLARALAEAAWTEPQGAVLGTVRYASPEQAQGMALTGRSDVYALALALVEAVTGEVPFATDTTLGTLMARVDHDLSVPDGLGPLAGPLAAAGRADVSERLDARALVGALSGLTARLPRPAPLPLSGVVDLDGLDDSDPTLLAGRPGPRPDDLDIPAFVAAAASPTPLVEDPDSDVPDVDDADTDDADVGDGHTADGVGPHPDGAPSDGGSDWDPRSPSGRRRRRWPVWVGLGALLVAVSTTVALLVVDLRGPAASHALPRLAGRDEEAARDNLARLGYVVSRDTTRRDGTRAGEVITTRPAPGTDLDEGETVTLVVSDGQTIVAVPAIPAGLPAKDAAARLTAAGLEGRFVPRADEQIPDGAVIGVSGRTPARLERGSRVDVVVSSGPAPRTIPAGLPGTTADEAVAVLRELGLVADPVGEFDDEVPAGQVIGTDPVEGTQVARDSTATVRVSRGPELVAVPDVRAAATIDEAVALLRTAGLTPGEVGGPATGKPAATDPAAGQQVRKGSAVDILLR